MKKWPEMVALSNHVSSMEFVLRFLGVYEIHAAYRIDAFPGDVTPKRQIRILTHEIKSTVTDAVFLNGFHLSLTGDVSSEYLERFRKSEFIVTVDGERVPMKDLAGDFMDGGSVPSEMFRRIGQERHYPFFEALSIDTKNFLGYFCINGGLLAVDAILDLKGLLSQKGSAEIEAVFSSAIYTTRR